MKILSFLLFISLFACNPDLESSLKFQESPSTTLGVSTTTSTSSTTSSTTSTSSTTTSSTTSTSSTTTSSTTSTSSTTTTSTTTSTTTTTVSCFPTNRSLGDPSNGANLYSNNSCIVCHGSNGQGGTNGPIIGVQDPRIYEVLKINPPSGMPDYSSLDDCDVQDIAAHIDTF